MYNNIDRDIESFINQISVNGTYASKEELSHVLSSFSTFLKQNKDCSLEEIISLMIDDILVEIKAFLNNGFPVPGIAVGLKVNNFLAHINYGRISPKGDLLTNDHLFDLASISKYYTGVVGYNVMEEGYFNLQSNVKQLAPHYMHLDGITIEDIVSFGVELSTGVKRINDVKSKEEAIKLLHNIRVEAKGKHKYTDMGMMVLKDVMETVTGLSFEELFNKYISKRLSLTNTFIKVPEDKRILITGTPNVKWALPNDTKAAIMGGFSGSAGVFANVDDLLKFGDNVPVKEKYYQHFYTPGLESHIGKYGVTIIPHQDGLKKTYIVDKLCSKQSFAVQGSTRTQLNIGKYIVDKRNIKNVSAVLMNPSSMDIEEARKRGILFEYDIVDGKGNDCHIMTIDARNDIRLSSVYGINHAIARTVLKLSLLDIITNNYEPNYRNVIDVNFNNDLATSSKVI